MKTQLPLAVAREQSEAVAQGLKHSLKSAFRRVTLHNGFGAIRRKKRPIDETDLSIVRFLQNDCEVLLEFPNLVCTTESNGSRKTA